MNSAMLKLLVLAALLLAVLYFFNWVNRRPPGDWRRGDDDEGDGPDGLPGRRLSLPQEIHPDAEEAARPRETAGAEEGGKGS